MTLRTTLLQARLSETDTRQLDSDMRVLGLPNRSEAVREALRLLHRRARHAALADDYDRFYGAGTQAAVSDVTAIGDEVAAETIGSRDSTGR